MVDSRGARVSGFASPAVTRSISDYCVSLVAAGLAGLTCDVPPILGLSDWNRLYELASFHGVEALTWAGLSESARKSMPQTVVDQWRNASDRTLFRQLMYDAERESILRDFHIAGLSWLPLKGIRTVAYYPHPGLRSMGDQDLVFGFVERDVHGTWSFRGVTDEERRAWADRASAAIEVIMKGHGYRKINDWERELSFAKDGLQFEFHRTIVAHSERSLGYYGDETLDYYANPWRKAVPDDPDCVDSPTAGEQGMGFHWKPEDEYIFHVSHMMKHAQASGFGLRFLADEAVFCHHFGASFDWEYIHGELETLDAVGFECSVRNLSSIIFDHPQDWGRRLDTGQRERLDEVIANGTYGMRRNALRNSFRRETDTGEMEQTGLFRRVQRSLLYGWRRIYPSIEWVRLSYPEWADSRWKRALLPLYRLYRGLRRHPADLLYELRLMLGIDNGSAGAPDADIAVTGHRRNMQ